MEDLQSVTYYSLLLRRCTLRTVRLYDLTSVCEQINAHEGRNDFKASVVIKNYVQDKDYVIQPKVADQEKEPEEKKQKKSKQTKDEQTEPVVRDDKYFDGVIGQSPPMCTVWVLWEVLFDSILQYDSKNIHIEKLKMQMRAEPQVTDITKSTKLLFF